MQRKLTAKVRPQKRKREKRQGETQKRTIVNDDRTDQSWLMSTIEKILGTPVDPLAPSKFIFKNEKGAAVENSKRLEENNFNIEKLVKDEGRTHLTPGTEFRDKRCLDELIKKHIDYKKISTIIESGVHYPFKKEQYTEEDRVKDLEEAIKAGNNKSAKNPESIEVIKKIYTKEVKKGFMLPIEIDTLRKIKGLGVIPIGCAEQFTINEEGERIKKRRLTHDCSRPRHSGFSVNNHVDKDELDECLYGHCLMRILHQAHTMRFRHPTEAIYMNKTDVDAAFRRLHVMLLQALLCTTIVEDKAYILFRLPFGSSPAPSKFGLISEFVFDLAQAIALDDTWDPNKLQSPHAKDIPEVEESTAAKRMQARPLLVTPTYKPISIDGFVDDIISLCVGNKKKRIEKTKNAVPLALHTTFRPAEPEEEQVDRDDALCLRKLKGEGSLSTRKTVLGWIIDTDTFRVYLPKEKAKAWIDDITAIIAQQKRKECTPTKELESLIGKLNHTGYILNVGRYFLSRLRKRLYLGQKWKNQQKLTDAEADDLKLWIRFLIYLSNKGRNINQITFVLPQVICISDACEHGMGGFNSVGIAWRYQLPQHLIGCFSINLLEFMAARITIKMTIDKLKIGSSGEGLRILSLTDSTSAMGWMWKANFDPKAHPHHDTVARALALDLIQAESALYTQHIPGHENDIADSLSRDFHLSNQKLTQELYKQYGDKMPKQFKIFDLPATDISWIESTAQLTLSRKELQQAPSRSKLGTGINGKSLSKKQDTKMSFWNNSTDLSKIGLSLLSQSRSEIMNTVRQLNVNYGETQSAPPSMMWERPSGRMDI
jgi:hypothetical protein